MVCSQTVHVTDRDTLQLRELELRYYYCCWKSQLIKREAVVAYIDTNLQQSAGAVAV
jgi:hypothetical protein